MNEVIVYVLRSSQIKERYSFVLSFVSEQRREKALRYKQEKDQLLSLGAGYLLKKYLPSVDIKETKSGKPYLENGPYFNISHSDEYVVLVIDNHHDVGVDIEKINEKKIDAVDFVMNEEEKNIKDVNSLFLIWSNKESLIKCLSTGLKDIKSVSGLPLNGVREFEENKYFTKSMIYNGYSLSVTLKGDEPFNIKINLINSLEEK